MSSSDGEESSTFTKQISHDEPRFRKDPGDFHELVKDKTVNFGDGGQSKLFYPVRLCPEFDPQHTSPRKELLNGLTLEMARVASQRNDLQQNGVVEDIVDPEFYPQLLAKSNDSDDSGVFGDRDEDEYEEGTTTKVILMKPAFSRSKYSWIPTRVSWNKVQKKARFLGPIQNLPRTKSNETLYLLLQEALTGFMEVFTSSACGGSGSAVVEVAETAQQQKDNNGEEETYYNICIKLQRYHIPPGSEYKGQWHTEGVNEEVSAVGVLYTDWPAGLVGGALKFRPADIPNHDYRDDIKPTPTLAIQVQGKEGSAMAFHNSVPHRFCGIRNNTDKKLTRSFVNFFVVSPNLPTTTEVPTNADIYLSLVKLLNHDVVSEVLDWLQYTPTTYKGAVELRAKAKAEMVATKGKWGDIHYGNCGQLTFLPCGCPGEEERTILAKWEAEERKNPDPKLLKKSQYYYYHIGRYFDEIKLRKPQDEVEKCTFTALGVGKDFSEFHLMSHTDSSSAGVSVFEG